MAQECCDTDEKNEYKKPVVKSSNKDKGTHGEKDHDHDGDDGHDQGGKDSAGWKSH
ncbi:MAG: hypothetical protein H7258_09815 [Ferruginibacter sp.]|nr:hypothetical protein [Ferruginibacter sp.]